MATRLYFHGSGPDNQYIPPVSPAYATEWERTSEAARRYCSKVRRWTIDLEASGAEYEAGPANDTLIRQFVSDPLSAQTISGTVKGQLRCRESDAAADFCRALIIKVVSGDGGTVRGTLLSHFPESLTSEFDAGSTPVNRNFPPSLTLSSVEAQAGDRLVIEIGFRAFNTETTTYTGYIHLNDSTGTDLPEDESTTDNLCGWLEFSADLNFLDRALTTQVLAQAEYDLTPQIKATQVLAQVEYSRDLPVTASGGVEVNGQGESELRWPSLDVEASGGAEVSGAGAYQLSGRLEVIAEGGLEANGAGEVDYWAPGRLEVTASGGVVASGAGEVGFREGKLEVTAAGGLGVSGAGDIYQFNPVRAVTSSGGIEVTGAAVVDHYKTIIPPPLGVVATGGLEVWGFGDPLLTEVGVEAVEAEGGVAVGGAGKPACLAPSLPEVREVTASGGVRLGGAGLVTYEKPGEVSLRDKAVTASGGLILGGEGLVATSKPSLLEVVAEGGLKVGSFQLTPAALLQPGEETETSLAVIASGGLGVGGEGAAEFTTPDVLAVPSAGVGLQVGGVGAAGFIQPAIWEWEAAGGVILDEGAEALDIFETWAFTGAGLEPSIYSGFDFNSYCEYRGEYYGAKEDGIYRLEGEDDDGRPIHTGVRLGPTNFYTNVQKRLRAVHAGDCGEQTQARIVAGNGAESYASWERGRLAGERLLGREFVVDLVDFDKLGELEFTILAQVKR